MATSPSDSVGARSIGAGSKTKKRAGWLKWLLLALLLLIVAGVLIALLTGGDDDTTPSGPAASAVRAQDPGATGNVTAAGAASSGRGSLSAGGQSLLGAESTVFAGAIGDQVNGRGVEVLSVVKDEGFFVGTSKQDRVYVEFGGKVGENETAADFTPAVGDRVNLQGELRPAPQDAGRTLRLERADAQVVQRQGAFVNATNVARATS